VIILNLLPPSKKAQLLSEKNFSRIRRVVISFFGVCALAVALTLTTRYLIQTEARKVQSEIDGLKQTLQTSGHAPTDDLVKKINQKANTLFSVQKNYIKWSTVLTTIGQAVGENITLQTIVVAPEDNNITISGTARTRTDLVNFQNKLKSVPFLENLDYPTAYLTIKENIPFRFTGILNQAKIPNYDIARQ